jgi:hypothetical protein
MNAKFVAVVSVILVFAFPGLGSLEAENSAGRLVIVRAPNFGWNLVLNVRIDGRTVANVVQGRRYDRFLPSGNHTLTVSAVPNLYYSQPTTIRLYVRPGRTYAFMAMWRDQYRVVLQPTTVSPAD